MCFAWISEQTAIISLYNIIGLHNRGRKCLLRGTKWIFKWDRYSFVLNGLIASWRKDTTKYQHISTADTTKRNCSIDQATF